MIGYSTSADVIYKVARQLNTSLDLDEVLGKVLKLTVEATEAERGSLFLLDEVGQVTRHILSRPNQSPEVSRRNIKIAMTQGLAGWVYRHHQGALASDAVTDDRWVQLPDDKEVTGSAVVVPLLYQDRINGLLVLHHQEIHFFDESHLALTAGIAGQAAIAVENARLFTQVRDEREGLHTLINAMPIPVLEIDTNNYIAFANRTAQQSLLVKKVNVPLEAIEGGDQLKLTLDELRNRTENHIEVRWPDERVFSVSINNLPRLGTVVAMNDITYLKELDAMKSQFVETVSHDLKNPLSAIMGFAQLLQLEETLSEAGDIGLTKILHSAKQIQILIEDLLDLAKIEAGLGGQAEPCNLPQIAKNVLTDFKPRVEEKEITLIAHLPPQLPMVSGNTLRLSQVVSNFVSNAIKYTPQSGQIGIEVSQADSEIWLRVSDNGPGISPAGQSQLFQKFYRVPEIQLSHRGVEGTGLGLSIVKAIVEGYGGRVLVESEVGVGSIFGCVLPIWSPQSESDAAN